MNKRTKRLTAAVLLLLPIALVDGILLFGAGALTKRAEGLSTVRFEERTGRGSHRLAEESSRKAPVPTLDMNFPDEVPLDASNTPPASNQPTPHEAVPAPAALIADAGVAPVVAPFLAVGGSGGGGGGAGGASGAAAVPSKRAAHDIAVPLRAAALTAPEIDPAGAAAALTLLLGGLSVRRRGRERTPVG